MSNPTTQRFGIQFSTPVISGWSTGQVTFTDTYVQLPRRRANQVLINNASNKNVAFRRAGSGDTPFVIPVSSSMTIPLADNLDEVEIHNADDTASVTLSYYTAL